MIKSELPPEKTKEVAMKRTVYRSSVENLYRRFQVLKLCSVTIVNVKSFL